MVAALGTAVGTPQREWYWTRAEEARAVGAAVLLEAGSGDGVQWLSQGSLLVAGVTQGSGSDGGGTGPRLGYACSRWWLRARIG